MKMVVGGAAINLSNLIWTDTADLIQKERSAFLVQEYRDEDLPGDMKYFKISFGERIFEDAMTSRAYLALYGKDGGYMMERAEDYMEERHGEMVLDLRKLPNEINGVKLRRADRFQRTAVNRWQDSAFHSENGDQVVWKLEGGSTVIFVIGTNCAGKSHFIERNFKDSGYTVLDIYDYQERVRKEDQSHGYSGEWEKMFRANELLKLDIVELVRQGKNVVAEQTFFRALRRIGYIEAVWEVSRSIPVVVYVMMPSDEQLRHNCEMRAKDIGGDPKYRFERIKKELSEIFEFPNPAEGFSRIYEVSDGGITERMDEADWTRIQQAREELLKDEKTYREKREKKERREKLIQKMEHIRFIHHCEVCGKRELLTTEEAFEQGGTIRRKWGSSESFPRERAGTAVWLEPCTISCWQGNYRFQTYQRVKTYQRMKKKH